jgi:hemolysin activation/secretion protein
MLYTAGAQAGMTDVILTVEDRPPYQVYVGTENNGMVGTERNRIVSGFSVGKLFGLDHIINFQYTGAYDYQRFSACSGQYMMLLPWGHMINIYGGYSALHANIVTPHNSNVGKSIQSSFRYTIPCHQEPGFMGEVSLGFDFKSTNNTLAFTSAFANYSSIVNVSQLVAEYRLWREWPTRRVEITTQAYWSPGEILPHESNSDYNALRPGAVNKWIYGRTTFRYLERLPMGFTFSFWARGQYSSQNLLPSEQMGIGGYSTVRGYDENQLTMDRAFIANVEFRTPAIPVIAMIRKYPVKDGLQFLVFADYGMGNNHNAIGTKNILYRDYLLGVGPGVRYTLDPYVSARLDWGIRLHNQTNFFGETSMVHFSTVFSY